MSAVILLESVSAVPVKLFAFSFCRNAEFGKISISVVFVPLTSDLKNVAVVHECF
jgi:hypothetical protein